MLRVLARICAGGAALLVLFGFAGWLHPSAQTASLLRPILAVMCLFGIWLGRGWVERGLAVVAVAVSVGTILPAILDGADGGTLRVYSKNLWFRNAALEAVVADIREANVDVVMLQEVSIHNDLILSMLEAEFPHQNLCRFSAWSGIAVLSRVPLEAERCSPYRALAAGQVVVEGRAVWVVSAHVPWPWPYDTEETFAAAQEMLAGLDGPVVLAGDFNAMPWTGRIVRLVDAARGRLAGPNLPTMHFRGVPLMIDLVIAPGGGRIERRPLLGSDHRGIVADVRLDP